MDYNKQPLDYSDIIELLKNRGLLFANEQQAEKNLQNISYFRLANYMRPMEKDKKLHLYKPNSYFENAIDLYFFDKKLRVLIFEAIQTFEIALRSKFIHYASLKYGPFWFTDESLSINSKLFQENLNHIKQELERTKEEFIQEHFKKYDTPNFPPAWKTLEVISFGTLSKMFCNFSDHKIKKIISKELGVPQHIFLESWVKSTVALRNCLAHHARVWNRKFPQMPKLPTKMPSTWINDTNIPMMKLYPQLCLLMYIQNNIHPETDLKLKLKDLIREHKNIDLNAMGFPSNWEGQPLWH